MSHNVILKGIVFRDLAILELAVQELVKEGVTAVLVKQPTKIRGWVGRTDHVDAAIMMPNEKYDIGLRKDANGHYLPYMENLARPAGLGAQDHACPVDPANRHLDHLATRLGLLNQRYGVIHAERQARKQPGVTGVRRVTNDKGQIQLVVTQR